MDFEFTKVGGFTDNIIEFDSYEICENPLGNNAKMRNTPPIRPNWFTVLTLYDMLDCDNPTTKVSASLPEELVSQVYGFDKYIKNNWDTDMRVEFMEEFVWLKRVLFKLNYIVSYDDIIYKHKPLN